MRQDSRCGQQFQSSGEVKSRPHSRSGESLLGRSGHVRVVGPLLGWAAESSVRCSRASAPQAADRGWLRASGADAQGGPRPRKKKGGGGPNGPEDQRTPVAAGPAPLSRMRAMRCSISGGTRRSPHHRCPQAVTGSVNCQRAPTYSVHSGTVARHSQLVGPRGPSHLHGRWGSEGVPRTRLYGELRARVSQAVKATPSTLGSTTGDPYAAAWWRLPRHRAASNGWPVCMIRSSSGTSFRAREQTALVPGTPRARIASYSGR